MLLLGEHIRLRAMEPEDCEAMCRWENDASLWPLGDTSRPFSRAVLREFIANASLDVFAAGQLRLMIERTDLHQAVGCVDLFGIDALHRRAGVGILIYDRADRGRGYAAEALRLLVEYAFGHLDLRQLYADIPVSNGASLRLFAAAGFGGEAVRRRWVRTAEGGYEDVRFVQRFR